jgi:hypothetical protein
MLVLLAQSLYSIVALAERFLLRGYSIHHICEEVQ